MSWGLTAAIWIALGTNPRAWWTVTELARWLALPEGPVCEELERLASDGDVLVQRAEPAGPVVAAMLAQKAEAAACD